SMEGDVAEPLARVTPRVDAIVLHAAGRRHLYAIGLDERRQRAGDAEPPTREILRRQEDAVQQAVGIVPQECRGQCLAVDRTLGEPRNVILQQLEEAPVLALEDVRTVYAMCLHDRAGQVLPVLLDPDVAEPLERRAEIVRR